MLRRDGDRAVIVRGCLEPQLGDSFHVSRDRGAKRIDIRGVRCTQITPAIGVIASMGSVRRIGGNPSSSALLVPSIIPRARLFLCGCCVGRRQSRARRAPPPFACPWWTSCRRWPSSSHPRRRQVAERRLLLIRRAWCWTDRNFDLHGKTHALFLLLTETMSWGCGPSGARAAFCGDRQGPARQRSRRSSLRRS
jgi:hypothetical protein